MEKNLRTLIIGIVMIALLSACQAASSANTGSAGGSTSGQFPSRSQLQTQIASNPELQTQIASGVRPGEGFTMGQRGQANQTNAAATQTPLPTNTPAPTPTATSATNAAVQTVQQYFAALQNSDFAAASRLISVFSLRTFRMTAGDVIAALTTQKSAGTRWSDLQVVDSQVFDDQTVLVHVAYRLTTRDAKSGEDVVTQKDELWPVRLEYKNWRYNWNNLIDFHTLGFETQTTAGLSMTPLQITRYADRISLTLLAQNRTNETIVIGTRNQTLATFYFGDQAVDAENTLYVFEPLRSNPNVTIELKGLFTSYPDAVEIVKYNNYQVAPWYTFGLAE